MKQPLSKIDSTDLNLSDKLIYINRVSKVMRYGKRLSFSALCVTGDSQGHVGIGIGKANEVPEAINKANAIARKNLIKVPLSRGTIPHEINVKFGAARVLLKPAAPGTGTIAGGSVRAILESAGVENVLTKSLGSSSKINVAKATILALSSLKDPHEELAKRKSSVKVEQEPDREDTETSG
jgi:small subunit ribosomal protein S5